MLIPLHNPLFALRDISGTLSPRCLDMIDLFRLTDSHGGAPSGARLVAETHAASPQVGLARFAGKRSVCLPVMAGPTGGSPPSGANAGAPPIPSSGFGEEEMKKRRRSGRRKEPEM